MQSIKELSERIEEELDDAEEYAKYALKYENFDKELADMFYKLSTDESKHYETLHTESVKLINQYKAEGKTVPEAMQSVYDYLHQKHIDHAKEVKMYQDQYKN